VNELLENFLFSDARDLAARALMPVGSVACMPARDGRPDTVEGVVAVRSTAWQSLA
jgi:hypothetical protein